jgi:hypothetical protein
MDVLRHLLVGYPGVSQHRPTYGASQANTVLLKTCMLNVGVGNFGARSIDELDRSVKLICHSVSRDHVQARRLAT